MYGTVARMRVKPGSDAKLEALGQEFVALKVPGFVGWMIFRADAGNNEYWMAVSFTDKEAYVANANSPEQAQRYEQIVALLESEPEWHDGEVVVSVP